MTRIRRRLVLPVLLGALVAVPTLAPTGGGTQARWSDSQEVAVGAVANDSLALSMSTPEKDPTTLTLVNESERLPGTALLQGRATVGGREVSGLGVEYAGGSSVELAPSQPHDVGVTVTGTDQRSMLLAHAGKTVDVTTTGELTSGKSPGWTDSAEATTHHTIPFPAPTRPGNGGQASVCTTDWLGRANLQWAWPDSGVSTTTASAAVSHWTVEVLQDREWQAVETRPSEARSAVVSHDDARWRLWSRNWFRIVGHPVAGTEAVPTTFQVQLIRSLGWRVNCSGIR